MYWRRKWQPTPGFLPGESRGPGSLVGCRLWGRTESDTTERLHFHFSLSCIGEGHGTPLQGSCLENPGDGGAWGAAICGVAQNWTRLKRLSSSGSQTHTASRMAQQVKNLQFGKCEFDSWIRKISWRRKWQHMPGILPEKPRDRGATVHGVTDSETGLSD